MPDPVTDIDIDAHGRILRVRAYITRRHLDTGEGVTYAGRQVRDEFGLEGDDAAHVIGASLGGNGGRDNIVPLAPNVNRGPYRKFENWVYNSVTEFGETKVEVKFEYRGNSGRPSKVHVFAENSKESYRESFSNRNN